MICATTLLGLASDGALATSETQSVLLLAVMQGLTEFLPISSSGHLVIGRELLGMHEASLVLDVALHVGTLLAVVAAYWRDVRELLLDLLRGRFKFLLWLIVATIPAGLVGVFFKDFFESAFQSTRAAGCGLLATAALLTFGEWQRRRHGALEPAREATLFDAVCIGCVQALALIPGISRSGSTISAGFARGFDARSAARLSFMMSLPAIAGAAVLATPDALEEGFGSLSPTLVLSAMGVAALVGWASLKLLLVALAKGAFRWFAAYCALLGVGVLLFL